MHLLRARLFGAQTGIATNIPLLQRLLAPGGPVAGLHGPGLHVVLTIIVMQTHVMLQNQVTTSIMSTLMHTSTMDPIIMNTLMHTSIMDALMHTSIMDTPGLCHLALQCGSSVCLLVFSSIKLMLTHATCIFHAIIEVTSMNTSKHRCIPNTLMTTFIDTSVMHTCTGNIGILAVQLTIMHLLVSIERAGAASL